MEKKVKGGIIINPFGLPGACIHQANRMKEEFDKLKIDCDIITDGYLRCTLYNDHLTSDLVDYDFLVFFDKDKYLSATLTKLGVRLFNTHEAIRLCDDKAETYIALCNSGVKMPKTIFGALCYKPECNYPKEAVDKIIKEIGLPMIVKQSFGSMGSGVCLAKSKNELIEILNKIKLKPHFFQEYLGKKVGVDIRVIVIGGKVVAYYERSNPDDFRSNIAIGGKGRVVDLPDTFRNVAEKTAQTLGLDYCGVDLLFGDDEEPIVCEVNSNAFMEGVEKTTGINVAGAYAKYILNEIRQK